MHVTQYPAVIDQDRLVIFPCCDAFQHCIYNTVGVVRVTNREMSSLSDQFWTDLKNRLQVVDGLLKRVIDFEILQITNMMA